MAPSSSPVASPPAAVRPAATSRAELDAIDASTRAPLLVFISSAVLWLLGATALGLVASWKLHSPGFLADVEWLTYGRVEPAQANAFLYGWGFNAAFAVAIWLLARLSRAPLCGATAIAFAGLFWNAGVTLGVAGILHGDSTSIPGLEMPAYAAPVLLVAYAIIGAWTLTTVRQSRGTALFVSQWYLLAALVWFPWLWSVGYVMLSIEPVRGTVQALVGAWTAGGISALWVVPVGLATIYYFLPKLTGRPISGYAMSELAFWTMAFFGAWSGVTRLVGGPVPAWVQSVSIAAVLMLVVPISILAINFLGTLASRPGALRTSPALRFIGFGAVNFLVAALVAAALSLRSVAELLHFTVFTTANTHQLLYAFFSMTLFGAIYYLLPRLLGREWPSATLIRTHFAAAALGTLIVIASLSIGGVVQGLEMSALDAEGHVVHASFAEISDRLVPYLFTRSLAEMLLLIGHIAFAMNFVWMLARPRPAAATQPLFRPAPALEVAAR